MVNVNTSLTHIDHSQIEQIRVITLNLLNLMLFYIIVRTVLSVMNIQTYRWVANDNTFRRVSFIRTCVYIDKDCATDPTDAGHYSNKTLFTLLL